MAETASRLAGKVALITGAGRGIGRAIAVGFAAEGASVCCSARTTAEIDGLARQIERDGGSALAVQADATRLADVEAMCKAAADRFGGIDIVVANAGGNLEHNRIEHSDADAWTATITLNLASAYYTAKSAIPYLRQRGGGKIITVGSGIGHGGMVGSSAYACGKAGLWMLTRVLAQEVWQHSITVNELVPGPVATPGAIADWDAQEQNVTTIESEWIKEADDVLPLAMFLATQPVKGPTAQSFSLMRRPV